MLDWLFGSKKKKEAEDAEALRRRLATQGIPSVRRPEAFALDMDDFTQRQARMHPHFAAPYGMEEPDKPAPTYDTPMAWPGTTRDLSDGGHALADHTDSISSSPSYDSVSSSDSGSSSCSSD